MMRDDSPLNKQMLERGYWLATHRAAIKQWMAIALYGIIALSYLVFFGQFGAYLYRFNELDALFARSLASTYDWERVHAQNVPKPLVTGRTFLFTGGDKRYDIVAEIYNPNEQWAVQELTYRFSFGEDATPSRQTFMLPQERKFVTLFSYRSEQPIRAAEVSVSGIQWRRMPKLPPLSWIYTEEPKFTGKQIVLDGGVQKIVPARVTWTVKNGSTLNLRDVVWQVGLYRGERLLNVQELTAHNFEFLKERSFEQFIYDEVPTVDRIALYPVVNIFDPNFTYLPAPDTF